MSKVVNENDPKIVVALDVSTFADAVNLASKLEPALCRVKVGKELFTAAGPAIVDALMKRGFEVFLDLKFHDIPNTVAQACSIAASMGVWMVNVHAFGGLEMMRAAHKAIAHVAKPPKLIAVTILTSMDVKALGEIGVGHGEFPNVFPYVMRLARCAQQCGLSGVVCSGQEAKALRGRTGGDFLLVTPGIRLPEGDTDDQVRVMTPEKAIEAGANYLVIGRPVTKANDPVAVLLDITQRINFALTESNYNKEVAA